MAFSDHTDPRVVQDDLVLFDHTDPRVFQDDLVLFDHTDLRVVQDDLIFLPGSVGVEHNIVDGLY